MTRARAALRPDHFAHPEYRERVGSYYTESYRQQ